MAGTGKGVKTAAARRASRPTTTNKIILHPVSFHLFGLTKREQHIENVTAKPVYATTHDALPPPTTVPQHKNISSKQDHTAAYYRISPGTSVKPCNTGQNDTKSHASDSRARINHGQGRAPPLLLVNLESCSYRITFIICLIYIYIYRIG